MPNMQTPHAHALVSAAVEGLLHRRGLAPVPLVSTAYDIRLSGGLAAVTAERRYRNEEMQPIEATLTFPLPVDAVLHDLEARIDGRLVRGIAQARDGARRTYEEALDRGKTAVLHEELLRGIHMLSVGNIRPGAEIVVTLRFAVALAWIGGRPQLVIPTTVGDVYGRSPMIDSDTLEHGGAAAAAAVTVSCDCGTTVLAGATLRDGAARRPLDAPIVLSVEGWTPKSLSGRAADGAEVSLSLTPAPFADADLDAAVLVDRSGSMADLSARGARATKHAAVLLGLSDAGRHLRTGDRIDLWEFSDDTRRVGIGGPGDWPALLRRLGGPSGGTEIGGALAAVIDGGARNALLVTDGKSYALDVQALAQRGTRISVVLVGEDSLEANVGHLAVLTGGEIFVAAGDDVAPAVAAAVEALRDGGRVSVDLEDGLACRRAGMDVRARWLPRATQGDTDEARDPLSRAVAAYAAGLRLARLDAAAAAQLAVAEGLVTHLTSLVLVDEDGAAVDGPPATRKVLLPSPAAMFCESIAPSAGRIQFMARAAMARPAMQDTSSRVETRARRLRADMMPRAERVRSAPPPPPSATPPVAPPPPTGAGDAAPLDPRLVALTALVGRINWQAHPARLADGDLSELGDGIADVIERASRVRIVVRAADRLGIGAVRIVIGLVALADAGRNRPAKRVARAIFGARVPEAILKLARRLGLLAAEASEAERPRA